MTETSKTVPQDDQVTEAEPTEQTPSTTAPATVSSRRTSSAPRGSSTSTGVSVVAASLQRFKFLIVVFVLILCLAAGFLGGWLGASDHDNVNSLDSATSAGQQKVVTSESQLYASIAKTVSPSVVSIDVIGQSTTSDDSMSDLLGGDTTQSEPTEAAGTGIIISSDGIIITNRHVVPAGTTSVSVTLSDGTEYDNVQVIGRTSDTDSLDIAFLKITDTKGHKLVPAALGDSSKVQVGDEVVAIGNALGQFNNSVTSGIISGYGRSVQAGDSSGDDSTVENLNDLFQTDAAINEGNSGGPLVNTSSQVIGINTATSGTGQNIGFAIPINDVSGLIKQVLSTGKFERSYLGVRYVPLTAAVAAQLNLSVTNGAYIQPSTDSTEPAIIPGSPADKAGLQEKDIITAVDGTAISQTNSLTSLVGRKAVGDTVKLTVLRDGKTITLTATVGAAPDEDTTN